MGLALDNPSDPGSIPNLTEHRYLGPEARVNFTHKPRHFLINSDVRISASNQSSAKRLYNREADRPVHRGDLVELDRREEPHFRVDRQRQLHRARLAWSDESAEGVALAHSDVPLPSDRFRRTPSLEREEAFRDETTCKRNLRRVGSDVTAIDASVAELYRLGVLYDDEHVRGAGFNFDSIAEQPAYTLRPMKRGRKVNRARGFDVHDPKLALTLELSMAELSRDDAIAQYLITPSPSEASWDEAIQYHPDSWANPDPPLRVLYELDSSVHSLHNDNDNDNDTSPDNHPELVCDSDFDTDDNDWAVLPLDKNDDEDGSESNAAPDDAGAWIVLG